MRARYIQMGATGCRCVLLSLLVLGGLLGPAQARSLAEIQQTKELRVCLAAMRPSSVVATPPGCRDDCTFSGPVYDEVVAFATTLGQAIRLKLLRVDWDEQFFNQDGKTEREAGYTPALLAAGTCDVYPSNVTKTVWRQKKLAFVTLFPSRMMVLVHQAHKARFLTPADLAGKMVTTAKDTNYHSWLQEQNNGAYAAHPLRIQLIGTTDDAIKAVDAGEVDFTVVNADAAIWATRYQYKNVVVVFPVGPIEEVGWAFRKEDTDLQGAVQTFFEAQKAMATSTVNQIWERAFGLTLTKFERLVRATR